MTKQDEYLDEGIQMSILESEGVEFLLSGQEQVPLSSIEGKKTCLFFSADWCRPCRSFTAKLVDLYSELKASGKSFEVVLVSFDRDEKSFTDHLERLPWLAAPFDAGARERLCSRFHVERIPSLIPLPSAADGEEEEEEDAVELVYEYGVDAYPFGAKRRRELRAMDEAMREGGKLEEILAHGERDYVISRDGQKIHVSEFVGKTIALYFAARWCPPCRTFTTLLMDTYNELVRAGLNSNFDLVFVSSDRDASEFMSSLEGAPWFTVPYEDSKGRQALARIFDVKIIPRLVVLGPDGRALGTDGRAMVSSYGAAAYPFTPSRAAELEEARREEGEGLPSHVSDPRHAHQLVLDKARAYVCDTCKRPGRCWVYSCHNCDFDLHPSCVL